MSSNTMNSSKYTFSNSTSTVTVSAKAVDGAGNWSGTSTSTYKISLRRLYIRQMYYSIRWRWDNTKEHEVDSWDNYSRNRKMGIVVTGIYGSDEARRLYTNLGKSSMVDTLYRGILGRGADSGGKNAYMGMMTSSNWGDVKNDILLSLINSTEAQKIYNRWGLGAANISIDEFL